ncbi:MAG: DUF1592 domain-containing protein, partial [Planctomycetota bacterium]|nr:DUF1592 domain-containing protein [Planctomycetota bacterium]
MRGFGQTGPLTGGRLLRRFVWGIKLWGVVFSLGWLGSGQAADENGQQLDPVVVKYFQRYCYQCHGEEKQKADRRLDRLPYDLTGKSEAIALLKDSLDAINRGEMPPKKNGVLQPPAQETRQVVDWMTRYLAKQSSLAAPGTTVMRRLNRFEYVNTLRDLLGLQPDYFNSTSDFPADATEHGFDNNGLALTLSDYQLKRYLEVAQASLEAACFFEVKQPPVQTWHYTANDFNGVDAYTRAPVTWRLMVNGQYLEIGHGKPSERHPNYVPQFARKGGVPQDGWYTISVKASAANRLDHGYDHAEFQRYQKQPLKMALWIAPNIALLEKNAADQRRRIKVWDLPDSQPQTFTQKVWLTQGSIPFVSWTNGVSSKGNIRRVAEKYHPEVIRATKTQLDAAGLGDSEAKTLVERLSKNNNNPILSEVYHGPCIRVWEMDLKGPTYEQWPPASHQRIFGEETDASRVNIDSVLVDFASRAFRQPVPSGDVEHYARFIRERIHNGDSPEQALKLGLAAMLTSPRFLYLDEGNEESSSRLNSYERASRLSYFLWSSMPDDKLFKAAAAGVLEIPAGIRSHVERMLADPRSDAFVEHFTESWLRIHLLGSMPPDPKAFASYYSDRLEEFFKKETRLYFGDLLSRNGSILEFLDSQHTFLNDALASHYGIRGVFGEAFRKVRLEPKDHRGGLLGQGSILTLTANWIETSPVVRGVWVLENILGTPPPPPPPDVEPLEPDTRGTRSIREQLEQHRTVAACADCHQKIDPLGF